MIPAEKNTWVEWGLYGFLRFLLRTRFHNVLIRGLPYLKQLPSDRPIIAFSYHTNWWDGLMVFFLSRWARHKSFYCMMDEHQLEEYHFFSALGAFSVDLENPLRAAGAVRYAVKLLQRRTTLLWFFPQGQMTSPQRPVDMPAGINYLATQANGAQMLPVAFRYEFFRKDKPQVFIEVGHPFAAVESSDERIARACLEVARRLNDSIIAQNIQGFDEILTPRLTLAERWLWLKGHLVTLWHASVRLVLRSLPRKKMPSETPVTPDQAHRPVDETARATRV